MTLLKRFGIAIGVLAVLGGLGYFGLRQYGETYSFAPESPEQARLAGEHAQCAGFYMVLRAALKKENPDYSALEANYSSAFERHTTMGFRFSPDKGRFKSQIEHAAAEFRNQVLASAEKGTVAAVVDTRMNDCFSTDFRSGDFVKRTLRQRADR